MTINLNINGKNCRLNIERSEEETFRAAGSLVNDLIESYHNQFSTLSSEDILTRVALDLAVNLKQAENQLSELNGLI